MQQIKNVAILGFGMMGSAIAMSFGKADYKVTAYDNMPNIDVNARIAQHMDPLIEKGFYTEADKEKILSNIKFCPTIKEAVEDADFIVECVYERLDIKHDTYKEVEKYCKDDAIIASNTSAIRITDLAEPVIKKNRFVGTHFWNPGHLIPMVEVVKSDYTDEATMDTAMEVMRSIGKRPARCNKDVPGFIGNRLQHALWREALYIVEQGIADAATVDDVVKYSFGRRSAVIGPLENLDLVGPVGNVEFHNFLFPHLCDSHTASPLLYQAAKEGRNGFRSGGNGIQTWTEEEMEASRKRLSDWLVDAARILDK